MAKKHPTHPRRPERICWGCDSYCPADDLRCGNGTERTPHPIELFGEDWLDWAVDAEVAKPEARAGTTGVSELPAALHDKPDAEGGRE